MAHAKTIVLATLPWVLIHSMKQLQNQGFYIPWYYLVNMPITKHAKNYFGSECHDKKDLGYNVT